METPLESQCRTIRQLRWWTPERYFAQAREWWSANERKARRVPVSQWESLRRCGESAKDFAELEGALQGFFWGGKAKSVDAAADRRATRGAVYRDIAQRSWGQTGLAESLLQAAADSAVEETSPMEAEWRRMLSRVETSPMLASLESWKKLMQVREFVGALVLIARAESAQRSAGKPR